MNTQAQKQFNILLIGDACEDTYTYGTVDRLSPEAPVPVFVPQHKIIKDGMASNVSKNLQALGCDVDFYFTDVCKKERLIDQRSKQHLLRIDQDVQAKPLLNLFLELDKLVTYDAVVISDYNKGTVDYMLIEWLRKAFHGPIFVDTKKIDLARLNGCYVKINKLEHSLATTMPDPQWLIVTQGEYGALWDGWIYPAESVGDVIDVCGAGDTFLAALAYQYLQTNDIVDAIKFAIKASAVTVQHVGVYAPRLEEIK
jgi:D-beta-D-heptose 7-phosphate kinase/D-beta-D-heptose 1-phosphate adenosyltransferase